MPRNREHERALPVGLFILLGLILLVGGILWLRGMSMKPHYTFTVAWRSPDPVANGVSVIYRGVQVGRVTAVGLSPSNDRTLVKVGVTHKGLKLPQNVKIFIRLEGITGQRFLEIEPPEPDEPSEDYITDGELVWGAENLTMDKILAQLNRIAENRTLEKILQKTETVMDNFSEATANFEQVGKRGEAFLAHIDQPTVAMLNEIERTATGARGTIASVQRTSETTNRAVLALQRELVGSQLIPNWSSAATELQRGASGIQSATQALQSQLLDSQLIPNISQAAASLNTGIQGIQGEVNATGKAVRGALGADMTALNTSVAQMGQEGRALEQVAAQEGDPRVAALGRKVQEASQLVAEGEGAQQITQAQALGAQVAGAAKQLEGDIREPGVRERLRALGERGDEVARQAAALQQKVAAGRPAGGLLGGATGAVQQVRDTAARFDCLARQLSDILDSRFLGFRLFFGKPGGDVDCSAAELQQGP